MVTRCDSLMICEELIQMENKVVHLQMQKEFTNQYSILDFYLINTLGHIIRYFQGKYSNSLSRKYNNSDSASKAYI